jgi:hypothetical protein
MPGANPNRLCSHRQSSNAIRRDWINELLVYQIIDIVFTKTPLENCHFTWKRPLILIDIEENQAQDEEPGDDTDHEIECTITFEEEKKTPEENTAASAVTAGASK